MNNLPPLSGAILISNPRKKTMAYAKKNSSRRRINRISRAVMSDLLGARSNPKFSRKHEYPATNEQVAKAVAARVAQWESVKNDKEAKKAAFPRGDAAAWWDHIHSGEAHEPSTEEKALRAYVKRQVAKALGLPQTKASRGKASQYRAKGKYEPWTVPGLGVKSRRRAVPKKPKGMRGKEWGPQFKSAYPGTKFAGYNADRMAFRSESAAFDGTNWNDPIGPGVATFGTPGPYKASGHVLTQLGATKSTGKKSRKGGKGKKRGPNPQARAANAAARVIREANPGMTWQEARKAGWAQVKGTDAPQVESKSNPFVGDLALTNPGFGGVQNYLTGYAVPVAVAGGAAGAVHALASSKGLTETLAVNVGKIPVVGEFVEENLPYTLQGLLVGAVLGAAAPMVGGTAGKYLALTGGAALVFGGGIDAFNYVAGDEEGSLDEDLLPDEDIDALSEDDADIAELEASLDATAGLAFGDLALQNVSALGDLALENTSALGDLALENGGFATASLSAPSPLGDDTYGQASYADAYYSGADFSGEEGQALLNGHHGWLRRWGRPSVRMAGRRVHGASHLAGKRGHRWGWLIRTVGWEKARQIASLPPRKRVRLIHKLRKAAIATYQQLLTEAHAQQAESDAPTAKVASAAGLAPSGADGAVNYLGDPALFMGA